MTETGYNTLLLIAIALLSCGLATVAALLLHKLRKVHRIANALRLESKAIKQETQVLYRQIEALLGLHQLLRLDRPLPALRGWAASPDFLLTVCEHVIANRPQTILECSSGASTVALARTLQRLRAGKVFSLEHDPHYAGLTREELAKHGLQDWATVIDAPLVAYPDLDGAKWYSLEAMALPPGSVGLLVVDGPPLTLGPYARYPAMPKLSSLLAEDCTIFLDDADRDDEKAVIARWMKQNAAMKLCTIPLEKGCARIDLR